MDAMTRRERMGYVRAAIGNASEQLYSDIRLDAEIISASASTAYIAVASLDFLYLWGAKVRDAFPWLHPTDDEIVAAWGLEIDEIMGARDAD